MKTLEHFILIAVGLFFISAFYMALNPMDPKFKSGETVSLRIAPESKVLILSSDCGYTYCRYTIRQYNFESGILATMSGIKEYELKRMK